MRRDESGPKPRGFLLVLVLVASSVGFGLFFWLRRERVEGDPVVAPPRLEQPASLTPNLPEPVRDVGDASSPTPAALATEPQATPEPVPMFLECLVGRVRDERGKPIAGAIVEVSVRRGEVEAPLEKTVTDPDGRYSITFERWPDVGDLAARVRGSITDAPDERESGSFGGGVAFHGSRGESSDPFAAPQLNDASGVRPLRWMGGPLSLLIAASSHGYIPESALRQLGADTPRRLELDFDLREGRPCSGDVRAGNSPAAGTQVVLIERGGRVVARARSRADGRYELTGPLDGTYDLFARHPALGTALVREMTLADSSHRYLPTLRLAGARTISGTVHYPDGEPVRALRLHARRSSVAEERVPSELELAELEQGLGLALAGCVTDDTGAFQFRALQEGRFVLFTRDESEPFWRIRADASAGDENLRLIYRGYRLRLTLERDRARAPLPALADGRRLLRSFDWTPESELPLQAAANGDSYFVVTPSDQVLVRAWLAGMPFEWTTVFIPPASFETSATLKLNSPPKRPREARAPVLEVEHAHEHDPLAARVRISVRGADGAPLSDWAVTALSADGLTPSGWLRAMPRVDASLPPLPPGGYTLLLSSSSETSLVDFAGAQQRIFAESGATVAVDFQVGVGGRLRLRIPADGPDASQVRYSSRARELLERGWWATAESLEKKASGSRPLTLLANVAADSDGTRALPGVHVTVGQILAPGPYRIRLLRGEEEARERVVLLKAGETLDLRFDEAEASGRR